MNKIAHAIHAIHHMDDMASRNTILTRLHPALKIVVALFYIIVVVGVSKYNLAVEILLGIIPILIGTIGDISLWTGIKNLKMIVVLVGIVGIFNPLFDTQILFYIGSFGVSGGMISFLTLLLKGVWSVLAAYLLMSTTSMEKICYGLRCLKVPKGFVTILLLIYRYIIVLLKEVERMMLAYSLRAPKQKGVQLYAWGSLVGMLLLRSMDRAQEIYESMTLRGFSGEFTYNGKEKNESD